MSTITLLSLSCATTTKPNKPNQALEKSYISEKYPICKNAPKIAQYYKEITIDICQKRCKAPVRTLGHVSQLDCLQEKPVLM